MRELAQHHLLSTYFAHYISILACLPSHFACSVFVDSLERQSQPTLTVVLGGLHIDIPYATTTFPHYVFVTLWPGTKTTSSTNELVF